MELKLFRWTTCAKPLLSTWFAPSTPASCIFSARSGRQRNFKIPEEAQEKFEKNEGFKLSFTPFFLEAAVKGILEYPIINSSVDGKKIIMKRHVNLGCAVAWVILA